MKEDEVLWIQKKLGRIVVAMRDLYNLSEATASKILTESETAKLIEDKVADLHCMSEKYLATLILEEYNEKYPKQ